MKSISLTKESTKDLGIHISYNKKIEDDLNFSKTIKKLCNAIKLWRMRKISLEGKIWIIKPLAISKFVHLTIIKKISNTVTEGLKQIQKLFLSDNRKVKIKQNTLRNDYKYGGLKDYRCIT